MATGSYDFEAQDPGAGNPFTGWTDDTDNAWEVEKEAGSGARWDNGGVGGGGLQVFTWDAPGSLSIASDAAIEILVKFRSADISNEEPWVVLFADGDSGPTGGYAPNFNGTDMRISRYDSGTNFANFASFTPSPAPADNETWWLRYMVNGSNEHHMRIWEDGTTEPGSWDVGPVTESVITSGEIGLGSYTFTENPEWDFVSYGTAGDSAPGPVTGITGTVNVDLAGVSAAGNIDVSVPGAVAAPLDGVTLSGIAAIEFIASLSQVMEGVSLVASAQSEAVATLAASLDGVALAANAEEIFSATLSAILGGATLAATATSGDVPTGALARTLEGATLTATAIESFIATLVQTLEGVTVAAQGSTISGELSQPLDGVTLAAAGEQIHIGTLAATLEGVTLAAVGATAANVGSLNQTLEGVTLAANAEVEMIGSIGVTLDGVTLAANGNMNASGTINRELTGVLAAIAGNVSIPGSLAQILEGVTLAASGTSGGGGVLAQALEGVFAAGNAEVIFEGTLVETLEGVVAAGSITVANPVDGSLSVTLEGVTLSAIGQSVIGVILRNSRQALNIDMQNGTTQTINIEGKNVTLVLDLGEIN